jgi:trk system potassium uptake protein TrkH
MTAVTIVLLATQNDRFDKIVFEAFSAFGTVGLSMGTTVRLDDLGKLLVIFLMFLGRVGPLTLVLMFGGSDGAKIRLPREDVGIG